MRPNPYAWQLHRPSRPVPRGTLIADVAEHVRRGAAVKVVGGRGMGKSALLAALAAHLQGEPGTCVVIVPSPPEEATVVGAVRDLAHRLGVPDLAAPRMDDLLEHVLQGDVTRLVVLFDETDQYVASGGAGDAGDAFARAWFNKLEATRRHHGARFGAVFAGGLGLVYLEREIGSAIVGRAEPCLLSPFTLAEIRDLAVPFAEDGRPLKDSCLEALLALSGGIPALVTYGLEHLWPLDAPVLRELESIFGTFRERHDGFIRALYASVSHRGRLDAPRRVLEVVRRDAGSVSLQHLRAACAPDDPAVTIDPKQALDLLRAAGLVRIEGSALADPVAAWPIASILNLPQMPAGSGDPVERLIQDVCGVLSAIHRFGRDFHDGTTLLQEEKFSSIIAVGLTLLGWINTDREAVQSAGFTDVKVRLTQPKVRLTQPGLDGHVILETKIWRSHEYNKDIQNQIDDYRASDTHHGIAVTLGTRGAADWPAIYEQVCLAGRIYQRLETPPNLIGRWRVRATNPDGREWLTDHLLVQILKRR